MLIGSTAPCAEMRQFINAPLQRIRASSLQTIRRAITEKAVKGNPAGSGDLDGPGVPKWTSIRKNTDFWFLKIPSGYVEVFKKQRKHFTLFSGVFFNEISMFLFPCYMRKGTWKSLPCHFPVICVKVHENFFVPLVVIWRVKVHGNFHVPFRVRG